MNWYLWVIAIVLVAAAVFFLLWRRTYKVAEEVFKEKEQAEEERKQMEYDRDWYRDDNLRMAGAIERLSAIVFTKKKFAEILDDAINSTCALCPKDKTVNETTGIPDACASCVTEQSKRTLNALKGEVVDDKTV